eukprot:5802025-Prymnesium_polylepis.1
MVVSSSIELQTARTRLASQRRNIWYLEHDARGGVTDGSKVTPSVDGGVGRLYWSGHVPDRKDFPS